MCNWILTLILPSVVVNHLPDHGVGLLVGEPVRLGEWLPTGDTGSPGPGVHLYRDQAPTALPPTPGTVLTLLTLILYNLPEKTDTLCGTDGTPSKKTFSFPII